MKTTSLISAAFAIAGAAAKDGRTFAVLRFYGTGPLVEGRMDPIINPGETSTHVHTIMGGNAFGVSATGESLMKSTCSNALVVGDNSAYWTPKLFFHDKAANTFEPVEMFYMNVYYFFEGTNDKIEAFPVGLQMVSGNANLKQCPSSSNGTINMDPNGGPIQPTQWTCPRSSYNPLSYPVGSDGSEAGIQDPNNLGAGVGLPFAECDGYASPLRMDLHFPSCYDPSAGLTNYKTNMQFPATTGNNKADCPAGWIHTPHLFYEVYWNTPLFQNRWTPNQGYQPFVLANGDATGCSAHGDFLAAWDTTVLQGVIDNCDQGDSGMDTCAGIQVRDKSSRCNIADPIAENFTGVMTELPGNNPIFGWEYGGAAAASSSATPVTLSSSSSTVAPSSASSSATVSTSSVVSASSSSVASTTLATAVVSAVPSGEKQVSKPATTPTTTATTIPTTTAKLITTTEPNGVVVTETETDTTWVTMTTTVYGGSPTPTGVASEIGGFKYAGCYQDSSERVIQGITFAHLEGRTSNSACIAYCTSKGYKVSGTEYGGQCFCGQSVTNATKISESTCDMKCEGDATQTCGGSWALTVYSSDGTAAPSKRSVDGHAGHMMKHRRSHHG